MQQAVVQGPSTEQVSPGLTMDPVSSLLAVVLGEAVWAWLARGWEGSQPLHDPAACPAPTPLHTPGHDTNIRLSPPLCLEIGH